MHSNELFPGKNLPLGITFIQCKNFSQGSVLLGEEYPLRNKILLRNLWWKKFHRTFFPVEELCLHKMSNSNSTTNVQNSSNCTRILYPLKWKYICPWSLPWCFVCLFMVCSLCSFVIGWKFLSHWYSGKLSDVSTVEWKIDVFEFGQH